MNIIKLIKGQVLLLFYGICILSMYFADQLTALYVK